MCKLARKGLTPSQIGVILRDSHGIAQVAHVTGSKILRILKKNGASRTVRATGAGGQSSSRSAAAGARSLMHRPACPAGHAVRLSLSSARVPGGRRAQGRHDHGRACRLQKAAGGAPHRLSCEGLHHLSCERPLGAARLSPFPCLAVGLSPELPEDLYCLIKKAVSVRKHLDKFRQDKDAKFRLILIESRIHRIARYYKLAKALPPTFKYESATASTLVS